MSDILHNLPSGNNPDDQNSKVELYIKRDQETETSNEIDLIAIFGFMAQKKKIYAWLLILCLLLGASVPLFISGTIAKEPCNATAVVTMNYQDADKGLAPDGQELNIFEITSTYVLQRALDDTGLSNKLTPSQIEANITIERLLSKDTSQKLEVISSAIDSATTFKSDTMNGLLEIPYEYTNNYIITLTDHFYLSNSGVYIELGATDTKNLLSNIMYEYDQLFFDKYKSIKMPPRTLADITTEQYDTIETMSIIDENLEVLYNYCRSELGQYSSYRSPIDGLSFNDLSEYIYDIRNIDLNYLHAFIYNNDLVRDRDLILTKYTYSLRDYELQLDAVNTEIASTEKTIENFKNDNILISLKDNEETSSITSTSDYYNSMIEAQAANYERKASLEATINDLNNKIEDIKSPVYKSKTKLEAAEEELEELLIKSQAILATVQNHTQQLLDSDIYRHSYMEYSSSYTAQSESILGSGGIKKIGIGMAVAVFLGLFIWFCDGLICEIKQSRKNGAVNE